MTRTSLAHCQHPGGEAAAAAATVLYACTEVGICVGCWAPPRLARGLAQGCCREEITVSISPGLPCGETNLHARGYGCARETLCAARRGEGARARETLCACRGRRSRTAGGFHELWAILVVCSTCDRRVLSEDLGRQGMRSPTKTVAFTRVKAPSIKSAPGQSAVNQVCASRILPPFLI